MQITEMPEIVSSETLAVHLDDIKRKGQGNARPLDFSKVRRITGTGLKALRQVSEELRDQDAYLEIDNIDNNVFKAIKIAGYMDLFRFVHRGEYNSNTPIPEGPRC